jgi:UDP-GlcNAc:undecaprenyl-phosphate GlcNAc-1-phosphate transferase
MRDDRLVASPWVKDQRSTLEKSQVAGPLIAHSRIDQTMSGTDSAVLGGMALGLAVLAFAESSLLCALVRRHAAQWGFLDRPGGHKGHRVPVPLGGGVAIWLTTVSIVGTALIGVYLLGSVKLPEALARHAGGIVFRAGDLLLILALASLIMIMGLWDDRRSLDWRPRLGIQILCAALIACAGMHVTLFWPFNHTAVGGVVTVLWIVGLTNAFNMLDNMDGLAASVGLIAALLFCGAQAAVGSLFAPAVLLVVVGALAGFLTYNWAPARLFMGDAGSNFIGFLLGALTVVGSFTRDLPDGNYSRYGVLAPLLVMAVPLYDMISVIVIRLREGRSPFQGDRRHFSHRLVARGLTPTQAVLTIDLVTLAGGLGALLLHRLEGLGAGVVLLQTCCLLGVVAILELSAGRSEHGNGQTRREIFSPSQAEDDAKAGAQTGAKTRVG